MANNLEIYETMCAYFDGELSLEEEKKFLEMVEKDPELKKEFEWEEKMIFNSLPAYRELALPASDAGIAAYAGEEEAPAPVIIPETRYRFYKKWAIAASILAIGFLVALVFILTKKPSGNSISDNKSGKLKPFSPKNNSNNDTIFNDKGLESGIAARIKIQKEVNNLARYEPDLTIEPPQLGQLQEAMATGEYSSIPALSEESFLVRGGNNEEDLVKAYALFYKGIALLELNKDSAAVITLKKVTAMKNIPSSLAENAEWNLSKAYFKSGEKEKAISVLQRLLQKTSFPHKKEGNVLLRLINKKTE